MSNKLIIGLFTFILLAVVGSVFTLKAQYDKIDKNDPFLGYTRHIVKPFKFIKLNGYPFGYVQIQPGKTFEVILRDEQFFQKDIFDSWKISGDTLVIEHGRKDPVDFFTKVFSDSPLVYVTAPKLSGITSKGFPGKVSGWKSDTATIDLDNSGMILTNNSFNKLSIDAHSGSYVEIANGNKLGTTNIQAKDSSRIVTNNKDVVTYYGADSTHILLRNAKNPKASVTHFGLDSMHVDKIVVKKPAVKSAGIQKR